MAPTRKVSAGGVGGALGVVICAALTEGFHVAVDATLAVAITTLASFALSYVVPEADNAIPDPATTPTAVTPPGELK